MKQITTIAMRLQKVEFGFGDKSCACWNFGDNLGVKKFQKTKGHKQFDQNKMKWEEEKNEIVHNNK